MDKLDCECSAEKIIPLEPDEEVCKQPLLFRNELPQIVSDLVESCQDLDTFHHLNLVGLPSRGAVIEIVERLRRSSSRVFWEHEVDNCNLAYQIGVEINTLFELLSKQITLSIRHECRRHQMVCTHCLDRGQKETLTLLKKIKDLRRILADDVRAGYQGDPAAKALTRLSLATQNLGYLHLSYSSRASYSKDSVNSKDDG